MIRRLSILTTTFLSLGTSAQVSIFPLENPQSMERLAVKTLKHSLLQANYAGKLCTELDPYGTGTKQSPADEGCNFIRNEAYQFTAPMTSSKNLQRLIKKSGGMEKFLEKYGLYPPSEQQLSGPNADLPMGLTYSADKKAVSFNCFLCHGQSVNGKSIEGGSNNRLRLNEFMRDVGPSIEADIFKHSVGAFGFDNYAGSSTAWDMSVYALKVRNEKSGNLSYFKIASTLTEKLTSKKKDDLLPVFAPPWWNSSPGLKEASFYSTGLTNQNLGHLMQFALASKLTGDEIKKLVPMFDKVLACVKNVQPPVPDMKGINQRLVHEGRKIYTGNSSPDTDCKCVRCHGMTERGKFDYPERKFSLAKMKTDPTMIRRLDDSKELIRYNEVMEKVIAQPSGIKISDVQKEYVAPPLVAMFTKSALLHNRSVPTLKQLLCTSADKRAKVWASKPSSNIFDHSQIVLDPKVTNNPNLSYYDTTNRGFSNGGHDFCSVLKSDTASCDALIEYLKTL